jgi:PmbA protein
MNLGDKITKAVDLLKERTFSDFEVYGSSIDTIRAESKDCEAGYLNRSAESGISIRILDNGSMGFAYGPEATQGLIDSAISSAQYQFKDQYNHIPAFQDNYIQMDLFDPAVSNLKAGECIKQAISLERSARDADSRIQQVRKAAFSRTIAITHIVNSHGVDISSTSSYVSASVMAMAKDSDDTQSGYDFDFSHRLTEINVQKVGVDAAKKATDMLFARKIKTMKIPVVFDNATTAQMLDFISDAFVGENVLKGKSYLNDKLGKTCFSTTITLSDNPLDIRSSGACPFDGEGVPSQHTSLVKDGIVLAFIYDSYWGKIADKSSTGNSVRSGYTSPPFLGIRHLCLEPGKEDLSQKLVGLKQVLKITDIMGMHTANPITGEFSVGVNGLLFEENNVLYPVREAALSGNVYEMFSRVIAVGDDARAFGNIFCPSILIDAMDISSQ